MDIWHLQLARAERTDFARSWANLEGKSATTCEDLYQEVNSQHTARDAFHLRSFVFLEPLLAALHVWQT
jgi:hypothetical protein